MGLGSTAKKLQKVTDQAEKLYGRMNEMREQLKELKLTVEDTGDRVETLDAKVDRQQAIIEAMAAEQGIDVDQVIEDADIDSEADADAEGTEEGDATDDTAAE